jgi:hypothetical protein
VVTGSYTTVCPDPLCKHESYSFDNSDGCKFSDVNCVITDGEWIYFNQMATNRSDGPIVGKYMVCGYNYVTAEYKVLHTEERNIVEGRFGMSGMQYDSGYIYRCL